MKPIATLMKPLRSVDLTTMTESPAAIERSDVCAVPAAAVVGEAMVAHRPRRRGAREIRRRLDRRAASRNSQSVPRAHRRALRARLGVSADPRRRCSMLRPILQLRRLACCTSRPRRSTTITPEIERLIDDMIETMYAAPGVGLAAPQVGVPLRIFVVDVSVGRDPDGLIVMVNPEFVERDGMQLEEEGCLSVPASTPPSCGRRAPSSKGSIATAQPQQHRRHRPARPRVPARDGSSRRHAVRRSPARHQARPDRPQDPQADARRQMVSGRAAARRVLRHAGVRRARRSTRCSPRATRSSAS